MYSDPPCIICSPFSLCFISILTYTPLLILDFNSLTVGLFCLHVLGYLCLYFSNRMSSCLLTDGVSFFLFSVTVFFPLLILEFDLISFLMMLFNVTLYLMLIMSHGC